jgi:hypothetical protein
MAVQTRCTDQATPLYPQKLTLSFLTTDCRSIGIVRLRIESHGVRFVFFLSVDDDDDSKYRRNVCCDS